MTLFLTLQQGIRRIVALTRQSAQTARTQAAELLARIDALGRMTGGPQLSAAYKSLKTEVDKCTVSLVDKEKMRTKLAAVYDTIKVSARWCLLAPECWRIIM
jgi:alanyl-tRNA synthetase